MSSTTHLLPSYARIPLRFEHGQGSWLVAEDGRRYLDFLTGIGVNALGHAHPRWVATLQVQLARLAHISNLYESSAQEELGTLLCQLCNLDWAFFSNSGSEANEAGLKMARRYHAESGSPRSGVLALEDGFHGRSMGSLSATWTAKYRQPFEPLVPGTTWIAPGDEAALEHELATRNYGVLLLEVIQGEAGIRKLPFDFLRRARELCDATGTLLMVDEVQSGCGRSGRFLACEHAGIQPDIVSLAKPLGGGLPIGATLCSAEVGQHMSPGTHGSTFGGGELACRAALVFLDELSEHGLLARVPQAGQRFAQGLRSLIDKHEVAIDEEGLGLMRALVLDRDAAPYARALQELGLLTVASGGTRLRFLPPFNVTDDEIDLAIDRIDQALSQTEANDASASKASNKES